MNNQPHWFYFYIIPLMPTVLTIAGWFFIDCREKSKRRLERKDRRIDAALTLLEKIEADALRYYAVDDADNVLANAIKHNLKWLAKLCARINSNLKVTELRTVTTGGDFESKKRMLLKPGHNKFTQISNAVFKLRDELEGCHDD
ncbi:hypothetical protein HMPREF2753_09150 [Neisseria sp. HMSC071C03]|nr:hypothetical protein HMPREF3054_10110 [Neisseria sp. HMSC071B12]OHR51435.1 hypothetical protein HMPREF2753_09150 [Neisseria sp. HMSC071C03]